MYTVPVDGLLTVEGVERAQVSDHAGGDQHVPGHLRERLRQAFLHGAPPRFLSAQPLDQLRRAVQLDRTPACQKGFRV